MANYTMLQMMGRVEKLKTGLAEYIATDPGMTMEAANNMIREYNLARVAWDFLAWSYPNVEINDQLITKSEALSLAGRSKPLAFIAGQIVTQRTGIDVTAFVTWLAKQDLNLSKVVAEKRVDPNAGPAAVMHKQELLVSFQTYNEGILAARANDEQPYPDYHRDAFERLTAKGKSDLSDAIESAIVTTVPEPDAAGGPISIGVVQKKNIRFEKNKVVIPIEPTTEGCGHAKNPDSLLCKGIRIAAQTALPKGMEIVLEIRKGDYPLHMKQMQVWKDLGSMRQHYRNDPGRLVEVIGYQLVMGFPFGGNGGPIRAPTPGLRILGQQ